MASPLLRFLLIFNQKVVVVFWSRNIRFIFSDNFSAHFHGFYFFSSTDQCKVSLVFSHYLALPFISVFIFQIKTTQSLRLIPFSSIQLSKMTNNELLSISPSKSHNCTLQLMSPYRDERNWISERFLKYTFWETAFKPSKTVLPLNW